MTTSQKTIQTSNNMKKKLLQITMLLLVSNLSFGQTNVYDSISFGGRWRTFPTSEKLINFSS